MSHTPASKAEQSGTVMHEGRVYQSEKLLDLLVDAAKRSKRFILTKDARAVEHLHQPEYHRYYADGWMLNNGTVVLFQENGIHTSGVHVFPSMKDMMMSSSAHEYELHWLDPLQPGEKEKTSGD